MRLVFDENWNGRPVRIALAGRSDDLFCRNPYRRCAQKNSFPVVSSLSLPGGVSAQAHYRMAPSTIGAIGGRPVITHTLDVFATWPMEKTIVVVIHPDDEALFAHAKSLISSDGPDITFVHGGPTRQLSVLAGLKALEGLGITHVMIHDAVRPFIDHALLDRCAAALKDGADALLPAIAVADTLKRGSADGKVLETVPRAGLYGAQTPQCFRFRTHP